MGRILDGIDSPSDLKILPQTVLYKLADEIRAELVTTVTRTGGHLASSLGVVELSIAIHRVFNSPTDKIVWDVGHQSYTHKLLTGRRHMFGTLRQYQGLSGFADRTESPHDAFSTGHSSTSISASLGIAMARDMAAGDYHVVAIIGDGSLTGGMAFEGLNQAGHLRTRIIVILNDNAMAISPSVGAVSRSLNMITFDPRYRRAKEQASRAIQRMPGGSMAWMSAKRLKSGIKQILLPDQIWGYLGFKYIGPIDGHDLSDLEEALTKARDYSEGPTFIHVVTTKGKGYEPAEDDCIKFHGISAEGAEVSKGPLYSEIFGQTLLHLFRDNEKLVAVSAAMMEGTCLNLVAKEFPKRVFDVGICEQHAVTFAAGLATQGFIPIIAVYSTFLQRAFDQVVHDVCIQNLPVIFAIDRAGIVGEDGKTHQGTFDLSYLSCIPNLILAAPSNENELAHLLYTATIVGSPMAIRYPRGSGVGTTMDNSFKELSIGKGEIIQQGDDLAIIAIGSAVSASVNAAKLLNKEGINCTIANARFAKPLDDDLIHGLAKKTKKLVTVEENVLAGGFGSAVLGLLSDKPHIRVLCIGIPDEFVDHGPQERLREHHGLDSKGIAQRILTFFPEFDHVSSATKPN